jgi:hypothetical protein
MTAPTRTTTHIDPDSDFAFRLIMLKHADIALFKDASQSEWKDAACMFFSAARQAKLRLLEFKPLLISSHEQ